MDPKTFEIEFEKNLVRQPTGYFLNPSDIDSENSDADDYYPGSAPGSAARTPGSAARTPGSAARTPGSAARTPGSAARTPGSAPRSARTPGSVTEICHHGRRKNSCRDCCLEHNVSRSLQGLLPEPIGFFCKHCINKYKQTNRCQDPECIDQQNRAYTSRRQLLPPQDLITTTGSGDPIIDESRDPTIDEEYPPLPSSFTGKNPFGNRGVFDDDGMTGGRKKYRKSSKKSKRKSSKKSKRKSSKKSKRKSSKKAIKLSRR
jgi:hypothetical protein